MNNDTNELNDTNSMDIDNNPQDISNNIIPETTEQQSETIEQSPVIEPVQNETSPFVESAPISEPVQSETTSIVEPNPTVEPVSFEPTPTETEPQIDNQIQSVINSNPIDNSTVNNDAQPPQNKDNKKMLKILIPLLILLLLIVCGVVFFLSPLNPFKSNDNSGNSNNSNNSNNTNTNTNSISSKNTDKITDRISHITVEYGVNDTFVQENKYDSYTTYKYTLADDKKSYGLLNVGFYNNKFEKYEECAKETTETVCPVVSNYLMASSKENRINAVNEIITINGRKVFHHKSYEIHKYSVSGNEYRTSDELYITKIDENTVYRVQYLGYNLSDATEKFDLTTNLVKDFFDIKVENSK